jgi:oxygen-dependent protoporphyrinogen oxidase
MHIYILMYYTSTRSIRINHNSCRSYSMIITGQEVFTRLVDPFISGIYAGDPSLLSVSAALPKLQSLEESGWTRGVLAGAYAQSRIRKKAKLKEPEPVQVSRSIPPGSLGSFEDGMDTLAIAVHR